MTRMILVRHGVTDWNREGRYQGQSDTPLNDEGWAQAHRLPELLEAWGITQVFSSDLARASETARILAEGLRLGRVGLDARLREIDLGEWEGQLEAVIAQEYPQAWEARQTDPVNTGAPSGETTRQVAERMWTCLDEIARAFPQAVAAVVSHGLSLATVLCRARGFPLAKARELIPDNATPVEVVWPPGSGTE